MTGRQIDHASTTQARETRLTPQKVSPAADSGSYLESVGNSRELGLSLVPISRSGRVGRASSHPGTLDVSGLGRSRTNDSSENRRTSCSSSSPLATIVVPTHNRSGLLSQCLESIYRSDLDFKTAEVIVYDDASTDDTDQVLSSWSDRIKVFRSHSERFPGAILCHVLEVASGRYLIRVDDDNIVEPTALSRLIRTMDSDSKIAFCGGLGVENESRRVAKAGAFLSRSLRWVRSVRTESIAAGAGDPFEVDLVDNFYACRTDLVRASGGFGPADAFPWSMEDALPQIRLKAQGHRVVCDPRAVTVHMTSSGRYVNSKQYYHMLRSRIVLARMVYRQSGPMMMISLGPLFLFHLMEMFVRGIPSKSVTPGRILSTFIRAGWDASVFVSSPNSLSSDISLRL